MSGPFSMFCLSLGKSAKVLSKNRISESDKSKALMTLGSGFSDVVLPEQPLNLSVEEAESFSMNAAKELHSLLASYAQSFLNRNPSAAEFREFAAKADPLWREIAAANWSVVSEQESFRLSVASEGLTMISSQIQAANNFSPDQTRDFLQDAFTNSANPMHLVLRNLFASQGVGVHHALKALSMFDI